jgi:hypothetical protein
MNPLISHGLLKYVCLSSAHAYPSCEDDKNMYVQKK